MKKRNKFNKIPWILLMVSIGVFLFASCKSNTSGNTQNVGQGSSNRKFDPQAMKNRYDSVLKDLVADKTITQVQADKVLEKVTSNMPKSGDEIKPQNNQQNNQANNTETKSNKGTTGENKPKTNQLGELVTSGVITQAQADKINEKLRENMVKQKGNQNQ